MVALACSRTTDLNQNDLQKLPEILATATAFRIPGGSVIAHDGRSFGVGHEIKPGAAAVVLEFQPDNSLESRREFFAFGSNGRFLGCMAQQMPARERWQVASAPFARDGVAHFRAIATVTEAMSAGKS